MKAFKNWSTSKKSLKNKQKNTLLNNSWTKEESRKYFELLMTKIQRIKNCRLQLKAVHRKIFIAFYDYIINRKEERSEVSGLWIYLKKLNKEEQGKPTINTRKEILLIKMARASEVTSVMFDSLQPHGLQPTRLLCPCDFPSENTGVGCLALLQGIFPTQG